MSAKPALFLDRDGVINVDKAYVHRREDFVFVDGIFELVRRANGLGYLVVIVTNQAGIGRGYYSEEQFHELMAWVRSEFANHQCQIDGVYFCPHHPEHGIGRYRCDCGSRKPAPGMFVRAAREMNIDLARSTMIGDQPTDMTAARTAGVSTRLLLRPPADGQEVAQQDPGTAVITNLASAVSYLKR